MSFDVPADAYARFMGRYSRPLATAFVDLVGLSPGQRVLDVGCGPGALTEELVGRVGAENVCAIDPASAFVEAVEHRLPGVTVTRGGAEHLPYPDGAFDAVLAQLVVHFMTDPVAGLAEMARVVRPGGTVAANVWDQTGSRGPLSLFWSVVREMDPSATDESQLAAGFEGQLVTLFEQAGMPGPSATSLSVLVVHPSFEQWWEPYTLGVGPAGDYVAQLEVEARAELRARCEQRLPAAPFTIEAAAWTVWWRGPPG